VKFELTTLEEYSGETLLAELRRVADVVKTQKLSISQFNAIARVHASTLQKRSGGWRKALKAAGLGDRIDSNNISKSYSEVLQVIAQAAKELQKGVLTLQEFEEHTGLSGHHARRHFGSWKKALDAAGLTQSLLGRRYTDEECFENILTLWTHYARQPTFSQLKRSPSVVGPKAYIRRWGGWRAALGAFVKRVNETTKPQPSTSEAAPLMVQVVSNSNITPRSISLSLRYRVLVRDNFRCVACGASPAKDVTVELHVDHIHPWSRGGLSAEENLRTLCFKCNLGKGARVEDLKPGAVATVAADSPSLTLKATSENSPFSASPFGYGD
jgi:5-methylcytosine-specific restriction endonuclease McrA